MNAPETADDPADGGDRAHPRSIVPADSYADGPVVSFMPGWVGPLYAALAVLLIPWIAYLRVTLPSHVINRHYNLSWVGFDILLLLALSRTAWLAFRRRRQVELPAVMTATLLIVDAWFDITTARPGWPFVEAILLAALVEFPLAALCVALTHRVEWLTDLAEGIPGADRLTQRTAENPPDLADAPGGRVLQRSSR